MYHHAPMLTTQAQTQQPVWTNPITANLQEISLTPPSVIFGAVAGGLLGDTITEDVKALEQEAMESLGIEFYETEVPAHYSREELQAWSKPTLQSALSKELFHD
mgnify:CR=1 FL=1